MTRDQLFMFVAIGAGAVAAVGLPAYTFGWERGYASFDTTQLTADIKTRDIEIANLRQQMADQSQAVAAADAKAQRYLAAWSAARDELGRVQITDNCVVPPAALDALNRARAGQ